MSTNPLFAQFLIECRELVEQGSADLLGIEREPGNRDLLDRLFRTFHTLKGSAALMDFQPLTVALHAAEDMLGAVRGGRVPWRAAFIDFAFETLDLVGRGLDELERSGSLGPGAQADGQSLSARLRAALDAPAAEAPPPAAVEEDWLAELSAGERRLLAAAEGPLTAVTYEPDPRCFYNGDDPVNLMRQLPGLLVLRVEPREPWPALAEYDPFACNLRLRAVAAAPREAVAEVFRFVADQMRLAEVAAPAPAGHGGVRIEVVQAVLAEQRRLIAAAEGPQAPGCVAAAARAAAMALRHAGHQAAAAAILAARHDGAALDGLLEPLRRELEAPVAEPARPEPATEAAAQALTLRVDPERVDRLVDLMGEIIVMKNALGFVAERAETDFAAPALARLIRDNHAGLDRLTRAMHQAILQVRMMPVGQTFQRIPRLVRDIGRRLDKPVELTVEGEDTEADKNVVESLFEPLLHLVRNALDHGIESREERRRAGKRETARLSILARNEAECILVEVADDGRGIDPAHMRRVAVERGLLSETAAAALSDAEARELVFSAGLSTSDAVTDISGRGVGMDVVRDAVARFGGRVTLDSVVGRGTTVRLALPLSLALTRIMLISVGGQRFGVPLDAVAETVRVPRKDLQRIKDGEAFLLRDDVVPLLRLGSLLDVDAPEGDGEHARVLVVVFDGQAVGLEVDGFGERLDVILRPLEGLLAGMPQYLGATLTGDGKVLLVLDLREILG